MFSRGIVFFLISSDYICSMYSLFISGGEILFILFVAVMVFGADKIPEIAKGLGKGMRQLRDATDDIKREIQKSAEKEGVDTTIVNDIRKEVDKVKGKVEQVSGSVKKSVEKHIVDPGLAKEIDQVKQEVEEISGTVKRGMGKQIADPELAKEIDQVKKEVDQLSGSVKRSSK